jgi:predicted lipoprotein with Yx(FWY)xxD motif
MPINFKIILTLVLSAALTLGLLQHVAYAQPQSPEDAQLQSIAEPSAGIQEAQQEESLAAPNAIIEGQKQIASFPSRNESAAETEQFKSLAAPNATIEGNRQIQTFEENASSANYSISLHQNATLGEFLVDPKGTALYYFTKDTPGMGTSNCTGACSQIWPPFYTPALTVEPGLNQSDFSTFTRADGRTQIAFMGWPLYSYVKDVSPGDAKGQGFNGIWFVIDPANFHPK